MRKTTVKITPDSLPDPGETVALTIGDYDVLITNNYVEPELPEYTIDRYEPAIFQRDGRPVATIHAVAMLKRVGGQRSRRAEFPACSPKGDTATRVMRVLDKASLELVTCERCNKRLRELNLVGSDGETT